MTMHIKRAAFAALLMGSSSLAATPAFAQEGEGRAMTIEDLFDIRQVGGASISPDGERVAYTVSTPRNIVQGEENGTPYSHLWVADGPQDGRELVGGEDSVSAVSWAADGEAIYALGVFGGDDEAEDSEGGDDQPEDEHDGEDGEDGEAEDAAEGPDSTSLYRISVDGGEPELVFSHDTAISAYEISEDGETLWFIAGPETDETQADLKERGFNAVVYEEDFSFSRVHRVDLSEDGAEPVEFDLEGHASGLELSADGEHLAVMLAPTPLVDDSYMETRWHIVSAEDGEEVSVIETPGKIGSGAFSPDGENFAFLAGIQRSDATAGTIHIAEVESGEYEAVAPDAEQHIMGFDWSGEDEILALAHQGTASAWVSYGADGEEQGQVLHDGFVARAMSLHADSDTLAIVADQPTSPRALWVGPTSGAVPELWTDLNPQLEDFEFGEQRVVRWQARDGVEVEGVLITPRGEAPEDGWPLINVVHGGPEAHDSNGWMTGYSTAGQIAAGEGFAVLYPNYRGSTGRGFRFQELDHENPPGEEFWDIVDGIDYLAEQGLVNADKVGITGGSYGGFASAWGATTASEHFAASVPFVALTDLASFIGLTDIPIEMIDVHFMEWPWENPDWYSQESPVAHAEGANTPTLIMHGEEDPRVAPAQSYILYRYLKLAGEAPVRLVTYPGEGHGNRMAAAQYDYAHRMMGWMRHYLQGEGGDMPDHDLRLEEKLDLN